MDELWEAFAVVLDRFDIPSELAQVLVDELDGAGELEHLKAVDAAEDGEW